MEEKKILGLIGISLKHSFSPAYFEEKFALERIENYTYETFPLATIEELMPLLQAQPQIVGLNVTIPYKEQVLPFISEVNREVVDVKAVNCIKVLRQNNVIRLHGSNTDVYGFEESLKPLLLPHHTHALVLGNGGAAKAVLYVLKKMNIKITVVARNADFSFTHLTEEIIQSHLLIINTTPLGMHPNEQEYPPILYNALTQNHLLYDLIYNPEETLFLKKGKQKGAMVKNGLEMLALQADKSWEIFRREI